MSTITKEWLQQKIADMESTRDEIPFSLDEDDSNTLAALRIALTSLEAEPVCVIDQSNLDYLKSGSDADVWPVSRTEMGDVLLYRAAPPAPVIPDKMTAVVKAEHEFVEGWNACRAAMHQGAEPVTTAYKLRDAVEIIRNSGIAIDGEKILAERDALNSPVIPDGWVACSERVPTKQDGTVFLTWNGQYIGKELFLMGSFQCLKPEIITHWRPLPEAPQQEA